MMDDVYHNRVLGCNYRAWQWNGSSDKDAIPDWINDRCLDIVRSLEGSLKLISAVTKEGEKVAVIRTIEIDKCNWIVLIDDCYLEEFDVSTFDQFCSKVSKKPEPDKSVEYANPTTKDLYIRKYDGTLTMNIVRAYQWKSDIVSSYLIPLWIRARVDSLDRLKGNLVIESSMDGKLTIPHESWIVLYPETNRAYRLDHLLDLYEPYYGPEETYYAQAKASEALEPLMPSSTVRVGGTFEEYSEFVKRFANSNIPFLGFVGDLNGTLNGRIAKAELLHAVMGMSTEANEMLTTLKKHLFYNAALDVVNMKEELGDLMWFAAQAMRYFGWTLEEILEANKQKLVTRYGDGYNDHSANNRDLAKEREGLQWSYDNMKGSHFAEPGHTLKRGR